MRWELHLGLHQLPARPGCLAPTTPASHRPPPAMAHPGHSTPNSLTAWSAPTRGHPASERPGPDSSLTLLRAPSPSPGRSQSFPVHVGEPAQACSGGAAGTEPSSALQQPAPGATVPSGEGEVEATGWASLHSPSAHTGHAPVASRRKRVLELLAPTGVLPWPEKGVVFPPTPTALPLWAPVVLCLPDLPSV